MEAARHAQVDSGKVFVPKGWKWDRGISDQDRDAIVEQVLRLPAWLDHQLGTDNLDVKKLGDGGGLWRVRIGDFRAVFHPLPPHVVLQRVFRKKNDSDYDAVRATPLVRSKDGLRTLVTEPAEAQPTVPRTRRPVARPARRDPVQNPLSVFSDAELLAAGLSEDAVYELRRLAPELLPDVALVGLGVDASLIRLVAELWEDPASFVGQPLDAQVVALDEREAAERLVAEHSLSSFASIGDARSFLALLDADIEEWMIYLHPQQRSAALRPVAGPWRVRGGAGTGKTVVALHRARHLADETSGEILLTTFINTLPKVWNELLASFPDEVRGRIRCRSVNQIARELYYAGGGKRQIAEEDRRRALIREVWEPRRTHLGGLSEIGLEEEFDHMIIGRSITDFDSYARLPRTGRGTPLGGEARAAVWEAYGDYSLKMGKAKLTYWPELRRDALIVLRDGRASMSFDAIVADEAQDLGEASVLMLAELAGGMPAPNLTLVGDGQQSIYPGGFSLLQLGIDIRGRATVLRTNWRNTHAIWTASQSFIAGQGFDDLEEDVEAARSEDESPLPMRAGDPPGLWISEPGEDVALAAEIVAEAIELGADPGNAAVLAPTNAQADVLRSALKAAGAPNTDLAKYEGVHEPVVRVGTFHRAKGLEFKHVIVTGLSASMWPPRRPGLDAAAQAEARARDVRAAFVAMTRARDRLDVVVAGEPAEELKAAAWAFDEH